MKLLVLLVGCVAICAAHVVPTVPTVPGDNSHYVEGESRYIWMSDDPDKEPVLVDLHEPVDHAALNDPARNGANNQYRLFTRQNPTSAQIITNGNANSVSNSNFVGSRPLKVIVHGWNSNGNSASNTVVRDGFLAAGDCNVIVVDWSGTANTGYVTAVSGVPSVGQFVGNFLVWLVGATGTNWNNIHLVGFSLGAHVVGNAGRQTSSRVRRVTGLDPAGPLWTTTNSNTLRAADGVYVECIHTDGGGLGINRNIGNGDFYPNGGRNPQPGCSNSNCSHGRANEYFASSVRTNRFPGRGCGSLGAANGGSCTGTGTLNMGNNVLTKSGSGMFHLTTASSWPF